MEDDWMPQAACRVLRIDNRLFFQVRGRYDSLTNSAKRVCSICTVSDECLEYSLSHNIKDGIWGGMTRIERQKLRRRRLILDRTA